MAATVFREGGYAGVLAMVSEAPETLGDRPLPTVEVGPLLADRS